MPTLPRAGILSRRLAVLAIAAPAIIASCSILPGPSASSIVAGPLCTELPSGTSPGAPPSLTAMTAAEALTWIPVATDIEAAARAAGLDDDLRTAPAITILAPTDDAFRETIDEETWDALLFFRQDELADVVEAHVIEGQLSLDDLRAAGSVTTRGGQTYGIAPASEEMVRIDGRVLTLCGDYRVANARIHVIDGVLGELPPEGPPDASPAAPSASPGSASPRPTDGGG